MTLGSDSKGVKDFGFTVSRSFNGSRDLLFKLWTDPAHVALWWGVAGATNPICAMDVRPAGRWRIDMQTASGTVYPNEGEFLEVIPNEKLVYTDVPVPGSPAWNGAPPGIAVHTVTFHDDGAGTKVILEVRFASSADHDRLVALGFRQGLEQGLERLDRLLDGLAPGSSRGAAGAIPGAGHPRHPEGCQA